MSKKGKDGACGKTTKDTVRRETGTSCKGRSTGKKIEEDRGRRGVMNIEWNYNYYQPWSDNEWLVDEMLAMLDEDIIMQ